MESEQKNLSENPATAEFHSEEKLKSTWQLFKEAWDLYCSRFSTWVGILSVPIALSLIVNGLSYATMFPPFLFMPLLSGVKIVFSLLFLFFNVIAAFAILLSIREGYGTKEALVQAMRNSLSYIFVSFLVCSSLIGGSFLFLVPGILFLVWFSFSIFAFVFEGKRGMDTLLRSKQLLSGNFWRVAGRISFLAIIFLILTIPLAMLGQYAGHWGNLVLEVFTLLLAPVMLLYSLFLFRDLVRIQGNAAPVTSKTSFKVFVWLCVLLGTPFIIGMIVFRSILFVTHDIPEPDDSDLRLPTVNVPREENAYFVFSEIGEDEVYWSTDRNLDGMLAGEYWDDALAQEILQKNTHALDVFERGIALPVFQQPELQDPKNYNANQVITSVSFLHNLARVNALKSVALQRQGREGEALDQSIKTMAMARMLQDSQGTFINYVLGVAIKEIGLNNFREMVWNSKLQSSELLRYGSRLERYKESKASLQRALKAEYIMSINTQELSIDPILRGERLAEMDESEFLQGIPPAVKTGGFFYYQSNKTKFLFAQVYRSMIRNAGQSHYGLVRHAEKMPMNLSVVFQNNVIGKILSNVVSVSFDGLYKKKFQETFSVKATQVLLALKAYERDMGSFPNSLQELVPTYLPEVPRDPFDGKLMRYDAGRRILYSTGEDLVDDGGDIDEENWQEGKDIGFTVTYSASKPFSLFDLDPHIVENDRIHVSYDIDSL